MAAGPRSLEPAQAGSSTSQPGRRREPPRAPTVQVHAHRGGAGLAPENTIAAFSTAVDLGVHFLELDVRSCATGELVVIHDASLERVAGSLRRVDSLSLVELQSVDVGSHFSPEFSGSRVPTLEEVLETFRGQVFFNVEIKEDGLRGDGTAERAGELIHSLGLYADVIVSSFNPGSLWRVRSRCHAPLGLIYPTEGEGWLRDSVTRRPWSAPLLSVYALHPQETLVTRALIRGAHLRGLSVNTWTVNSEQRMRELVQMGVSGIITDRPDLALALVGELAPAS